MICGEKRHFLSKMECFTKLKLINPTQFSALGNFIKTPPIQVLRGLVKFDIFIEKW
jgi:hypothetical protein